jgi:hypothetical protein
MSSERLPSAIRSEREADPELELQIDAFVLSLGEEVDALQDAEAGAQLDLLARRAARFGATAAELGYPALARGAERIRDAVGERNPEAVRKAVEDVTDLAQRVRRGHRSAAT